MNTWTDRYTPVPRTPFEASRLLCLQASLSCFNGVDKSKAIHNYRSKVQDSEEMEDEVMDAQSLEEWPGAQLSVEERDREWKRVTRTTLNQVNKYIHKRLNEMTRVRKRLYGHLPYGKAAIPEVACLFLLPSLQYPSNTEQVPVINFQPSFSGSSFFSGNRILEAFAIGARMMLV